MGGIRVLYVTQPCYLDDSAFAASARRLLSALQAQGGFEDVVVSGRGLDLGPLFDRASWLAGRDWRVETGPSGMAVRSDRFQREIPPHSRLVDSGVKVIVHRWPPEPRGAIAEDDSAEFLALVEMTLDSFHPDLLVTLDGPLAGAILQRGKVRGVVGVELVGELDRSGPHPPPFADATIAPTRFAADFYQAAFGPPCMVLPPLRPFLEPCDRGGASYVTFVDPTPAHGGWVFARIADELGRLRPEIPLLVVEGRGTEADLAACGLDLRVHGNLSVMSEPSDPVDFWKLTRVVLVPSVGWDGPPGAGTDALALGIPSLVADRGGLAEVMEGAGVLLPLPGQITPATRVLPTADEVAPWVEAIIRLWDDPEFEQDQRSRAWAAAQAQWPDDLLTGYVELFEGLRSGVAAPTVEDSKRGRSVVLVPHLHGVDWECEQGLRALEQGGVKVVRRVGSSAIDAARNELASNALHDGFEVILFIDADIGFDPADAFRIMARPEPVLCGIYAKKGTRGLASVFDQGTSEVFFGPEAAGPYPVRFAATGFLMIKTWVLRTMIERLELPLCNTKWGRGFWPFFLPMIVPHDGDRLHYLGEDWAFSHRLAQIGICPKADTSIRLWHWGRHPYSWEDAGESKARYRSYNIRVADEPG